MKLIGFVEFPETIEEECEWEPRFFRVALHSKVLVVAKTRIEGAWSAYIFPVPGHFHGDEMYLWQTEGCKLQEHIARAIFPQFKDISYAR